ncbi:uncharacterized protein LOC128373952 [Scomber japonicus]|uniref:uncharacterized protein LOC128373952 n=1 Tax=Scomber japonicus TaxID=13676 RepID=UPI0023065E03|nr:uncharacterized protein LOC128373952 [Scomber japonicus]
MQSNRPGVSSSLHSTISSRARINKRNKKKRYRARRAMKRRCGYAKKRQLGLRPGQRRSGHSSPQSQSPQRHDSNSDDQNLIGQLGTQAQSISEQDLTSCHWLGYGAHIGNETRNIEFKNGQGNYMQTVFSQHVSKYGSAFLNSEGGSLVVGVNDSGLVCGVHFNHEEEDKTRLLVDRIVRLFHPPLLPHQYSLRFIPVVKLGLQWNHLKVLCLTFKAPPGYSEPTLYQTEEGYMYIRRDGSVEGPLTNAVILEWSKQKWKRKVDKLEQYLYEARSEMWFLAGQVFRIPHFITPLYNFMATLQNQQRSPPDGDASANLVQPPAESSCHARSAHNSRAPDQAEESPPPPPPPPPPPSPQQDRQM